MITDIVSMLTFVLNARSKCDTGCLSVVYICITDRAFKLTLVAFSGVWQSSLAYWQSDTEQCFNGRCPLGVQ